MEQPARREDHDRAKDDKARSRLSVAGITYAVDGECRGLLQKTAEKR